MAYDASSGKVVMFGGHDGNDYLAETWSFDPKKREWTRHDVAGPSKRYVANMASDGTGVVLFSGTDGWTFDETGRTPADGPGHLNDTWTWRHGAWTEEHPGTTPLPPVELPRAQFSNDTPIVMPLPPPPPGCPGTTCPPDKANPYPSPITVSGLEGKVADVRVSLHGVVHTQNNLSDLDIMLVAPDGRAVMVMSDTCEAPPPKDVTTKPPPRPAPIDLTFDDAGAGPLPPKTPCTTGTYRPTDLETPESTPFHHADAFVTPAPPGTSSATLADLRGVEPNGEWKLYVVDDTPNDTNPVAEAGRIYDANERKSWTIDITTTDAPIAPPTPLASPPGRGRAAVAYHQPTNKVVLYGGTQEHQDYDYQRGIPMTSGRPFHPLGDTWTWDVAAKTWTQEGAGTHPGARRSAAMALHPGTGQLMLFGGSQTTRGRVANPAARPTCEPGQCRNGGPWLNDTWTWNGTAWARQSPPGSPPGAYLAGMARDSAGRLVLVARSGSEGCHLDVGTPARCEPQPRRAPGGGTSTAGVLPADAASTSVATARVIDLHGNGMAGLEVSFATDGDARLSAVTDRGDGTYTVVVTASGTGGIETITVSTPLGTSATTLNEVAQDVCAPGRATSGPGTWTGPGQLADMPSSRNSLAAATGADGRIYTFGGGPGHTQWGGFEAFIDNVGGDKVEAYNPCANSWQVLPPMPAGGRGSAGRGCGSRRSHLRRRWDASRSVGYVGCGGGVHARIRLDPRSLADPGPPAHAQGFTIGRRGSRRQPLRHRRAVLHLRRHRGCVRRHRPLLPSHRALGHYRPDGRPALRPRHGHGARWADSRRRRLEIVATSFRWANQ